MDAVRGLVFVTVVMHSAGLRSATTNGKLEIQFWISLEKLLINLPAAGDITGSAAAVSTDNDTATFSPSMSPLTLTTTTTSSTTSQLTSLSSQSTAATGTTPTTATQSTQTTATSMTPSSSQSAIGRPSTTVSPTEVYGVIAALKPELEARFSSVVGYVNMYVDQTPRYSNNYTRLNLTYTVFYNTTTLFSSGLLFPNSAFVDQLYVVSVNVSKWTSSKSFNGFIVDQQATQGAMNSTLSTVNSMLGDATWVCSNVQCPFTNQTCYFNTSTPTTPAVCVDKCKLYLVNSRCASPPSVAGVYVVGKCSYDDLTNEPYCDCGKSAGDVMSNFYDGKQCVNVAFVVAMAACAGGFFFLLLLVALCALCVQKKKLKKARKSSAYHTSSPSSQLWNPTFTGGGNNNYAYEPPGNEFTKLSPAEETKATIEVQTSIPLPRPDYDQAFEDADHEMAAIRM